MDLKAVRRRCEATLRDVDVPVPFDVDTFSRTVSERRGRPLFLIPKPGDLGPCGIWLALASADYVFYENATSRPHREHIILHELGHLLSDHVTAEVHDDGVLRQLLPSFEPSVVRRVLGRTTYSAVEEQEAEMIASLVLERAGRRPVEPATASEPGVSAVLARLNSTLGGTREAKRG